MSSIDVRYGPALVLGGANAKAVAVTLCASTASSLAVQPYYPINGKVARWQDRLSMLINIRFPDSGTPARTLDKIYWCGVLSLFNISLLTDYNVMRLSLG